MLPTKIPANLLHYLIAHDLNTFPWCVEVQLFKLASVLRTDGGRHPERLNIAFARPIENIGELAALLNGLAELAPEQPSSLRANRLGRQWAAKILNTKSIDKLPPAYRLTEAPACSIKILKILRPPQRKTANAKVPEMIDVAVGKMLYENQSAVLIRVSGSYPFEAVRTAVRNSATKRERELFVADLGEGVYLICREPRQTSRAQKGRRK